MILMDIYDLSHALYICNNSDFHFNFDNKFKYWLFCWIYDSDRGKIDRA